MFDVDTVDADDYLIDKDFADAIDCGRTNQREATHQRTDEATRTVSEAHQGRSHTEASRLTQI